jgi:Rrf2 family protein
MRLSSTDIYAFQALGFLGTQPREQWVSSDDINRATGIAKPYLVRILANLNRHNIVISKKGVGGGYALAAEADTITLKTVMRAIDGPVAPLACVSLNWHQACPEENHCQVRSSVWERIRDAMLAILDEVTVADLAADFQQGTTYHACLERLLRPSL